MIVVGGEGGERLIGERCVLVFRWLRLGSELIVVRGAIVVVVSVRAVAGR